MPLNADLFLFGKVFHIYSLFHILGFVAVFAFNLIYCKKYRIKKGKTVILTVLAYSQLYLLIYILAWVENLFSNWGANNIVRGFIYLPLLLIPICRVLKLNFKNTCDFVTPCVCISHGVSHIGCIFQGCCHGYESSFGIYNPTLCTVTFPVQIFESLTALLIAVVIILYAKKTNYKSNGRLYPIFLVLFGVTRFFWEFLRDNDKLFLNISALALHAALMVVVGTVWLVIDYRKHPRKKSKLQKNSLRNM